MNKRQRKKQFKKQYGVNPKDVTNAINRLPDIVNKLARAFVDMADSVIKFTNEFPQKIKDMPEEDFQILMDNPNISPSSKFLAMCIRSKKGGD